jgi:hypothetical protein
MSSVKINGKKYKARRLLPNELTVLNINEPAKLVTTSAGERLAVKQDDKWIFYAQKPINTVRL